MRTRQQVVAERAIARCVADNERLRALRRAGDDSWTAQIMVAGVHRMAVVCDEQGVEVGASLGELQAGAAQCREAVACWAAQVNPRLRRHTVEVAGDEVTLVGRAGIDAGEQEISELIAGTIAVCGLVTPHLGGLLQPRIARAFLQIRGQGS